MPKSLLTDFNLDIHNNENSLLYLQNIENEVDSNNYFKVTINIYLLNMGCEGLILPYKSKNRLAPFSSSRIRRRLINLIGNIYLKQLTMMIDQNDLKFKHL